jgi:hypothetical protein
VRLGAVRAQKKGRDERRDHARDEQAHQHRQDDGKTKRLEILAGNSGHHRNRKEHGDDRHGRREHRQPDLVRSIERRLVTRFAHACGARYFDLDDRIVGQNARDRPWRSRHEVHRDAVRLAKKNAGIAEWNGERRAVARMSQEDQRDEHHGTAPSISPHRRAVRASVIRRGDDLEPDTIFFRLPSPFPRRGGTGRICPLCMNVITWRRSSL